MGTPSPGLCDGTGHPHSVFLQFYEGRGCLIPFPGATVLPSGWGLPRTMPAQFGYLQRGLSSALAVGKLNHVKAGGRESTTSSKTFF